MVLHVSITIESLSTVKPNSKKLESYQMRILETRKKFVVEFKYPINGEKVNRKFVLYRTMPQKLARWLIRYNKRKFEGKVLRYLARMEW